MIWIFMYRQTWIIMAFVVTPLITMSALPSESKINDCFIASPTVLHVDEYSAQFVWVTPAGLNAGEISVTPYSGGQQQRITADVTTPRFQKRDENNPEVLREMDHLRHLAKVDGLEPFTEYRYHIECGDDATTSSGRFTTSPESGQTDAFDFVVVSDGHADRMGGQIYGPIAEAVGGVNPAFVIHTGDLTGGWGPDWDRWLPYFTIARPYLQSSVLRPVAGGHDVNETARNFRAFFAFNDPDGDPADEDDMGTYYTFTFGNAQFFLIDHTYDLETQLEWVERELAASEAEWKIVALHQSFANVGSRGNFFSGLFNDHAEVYEQYGVDIVISGHDHIYERNLPFGSQGVKPVNYIAINSGGNFREIRPSPILEGGIGRQEHMYAHFNIDDKRLEMTARRADGTLLDYLELVKGEDGMYQELVMDKAVDRDLAIEIAHLYTGQDVASDLRYARRDLQAEFDSFPEDEAPLMMTLNVSSFPRGSEIFFYEQRNPELWRIKQQSIEVTGNTVEVEVTAPENFGTTHRSWSPDRSESKWTSPPSFQLNVRIDDRMFESVTIYPSLGVSMDAVSDR